MNHPHDPNKPGHPKYDHALVQDWWDALSTDEQGWAVNSSGWASNELFNAIGPSWKDYENTPADYTLEAIRQRNAGFVPPSPPPGYVAHDRTGHKHG